ncbi:MAG TPA: dihydroorotate dehydrogenase electron transfer subunit [Blastocatellia bacterium]|nr:dihydroorotate dehydrogenase electron transfer subunit [Blastocatellia bacterium]
MCARPFACRQIVTGTIALLDSLFVSVIGMLETVATVEENRQVATGYQLLTLSFGQQIRALPGQFAMLRPHAAFEPLLRRAFAFYKQPGPNQLSFLYQVLGRGTQALAGLGRGAKIDALVPLGNSWPVPAAGRIIVVSGGIGSASVLMICQALKLSGVETQILFGAASRDVAAGCGLADFESLAMPLAVTTDDGSLGERGFVTQPLERILSRSRDTEQPTIYACGPWAMMSRVAEIAAEFEAPCLVSLEAPMGCGFGVCVGCVVAVKTDQPAGYESYKRVCVDGSIFPASAIRWEVNAMSH